MQRKNLTKRQVHALVAIRNFAHLHGYAPTVRELCDILGIARGSVQQHIEALCRKGVLRRKPGSARTLEVLQAA